MNNKTNQRHFNNRLQRYTDICADAHMIMSPPTFLGIRPANTDGNYGNDKEAQYYEEYANDPTGFRRKAQEQWSTLKDLYESQGIKVIQVPSMPDLTDQVFTADPILTLKDDKTKTLVILTSKFTNAARALETLPSLSRKWDQIFPEHSIVQNQMTHNFEGTGDCIYDPARDIFFAGYTGAPDANTPSIGRSSIDAHAELTARTGIDVVSLELTNGCFHVDTCLSPLPTGHILVYKDGMTQDAFDTLVQKAFIDKGLDPQEYLITVSENDAKNNFATNLSCVGNKIFMPEFGEDVPPVSTDLIERLEDIGYTVHLVEYGQLIKVGGAVHCTSQLIQPRFHSGILSRDPANDPQEPKPKTPENPS